MSNLTAKSDEQTKLTDHCQRLVAELLESGAPRALILYELARLEQTLERDSKRLMADLRLACIKVVDA